MNIVTEMKNTLEGSNTRLHEEQDQMSDLEEKVAENTQSERGGEGEGILKES